ncbi:PDR/VanB family oxidoreductase [Entomomonas asaccharolytica]|uniref:Oxidoreductase n=1 Tax=Entomomonas asaccharolytica TaxID=2785331 RepID=A0A974NGL6_9GAMM|nr:PDR/VanB family oxidoreductase [Entomomonas asaccharolytica]QQP86142.1 oxidoreductase [Entomomonas asaccharolytica]
MTKQKAFVSDLQKEAEGILGIKLRPIKGTYLAPFTPGAHIDLYLPNQLVRSYALVNSPDERDHYRLAVLYDRYSRGGSAYIHQLMHIDEQIDISLPRNNFPLNEQAEHTVLIAGGIGIPPIFCMLNRLLKLGRSVELVYCTRSRAETAFLDELEKLNVKITWHFDDEMQSYPDFEKYLVGHSKDTHFYCCGPVSMQRAFDQVCKKFGYMHLHNELFTAGDLVVGDSKKIPHSYQVYLAKSNKTFEVMVGKSLLDTFLENGIELDYVCRGGVCGSCKTTVLEGIPDHHDGVLSDEEKQANNVMMICVSGCKSGKLVLDL